VPARETAVAPVREEARGIAGRALLSHLDARGRNAGRGERGGDGAGEIERGLSGGMGQEERGIELRGHFGADGKAAGVKARPDRGDDSLRADPALAKALDGGGTDSVARATPSAVDQRSGRAVLGHQRDRRATDRGL